MKQKSMFDFIKPSSQTLKVNEKDQTSVKKKEESIQQDSQESFKHQKARLIRMIDSEDENKDKQQIVQTENHELKQAIEDELDKYSFTDQKQKQKQPFKTEVKQIAPKRQIQQSYTEQPKKPNKKQPQLKEESAVKQEEEQMDDDKQNDFEDSTPDWALPGQSRDKQMKLHGTSEADPTTLYIPTKDFNKLTKAMQQFWTIKSDNFDKVIFFKLGKFYELFYEDAAIGNKYLDLNWMGKKMHTGFPEKVLNKYAKMLVELGFKVAVVDQTETPELMAKRIEKNKGVQNANTAKVVERELTQVLTKGSYLYEDGEEQPLDDRFILAIRKDIIDYKNSIEEYGIAMLERQTNQITLNHIQCADDSYNELKTFLLQIKPIEVIIDPLNISQNDPIYKMIQSQVINSVITTVIAKNNNWDYRNAMMKIQKVKGEDNLPQPILYFKETFIVNQALSGLITFLEQILIFERVVGCATFKVYDRQHSLQSKMIIDSQALQHLEILQLLNPMMSQKDYSLFSVIDKTSTPGGHRLLKQWLCAPLYNLDQINERQLAVQDMSANKRERDQMKQVFKLYPDFQRTCSRIYEYSIKASQRAVFYEEISKTKLKEFKKIISKFREAYNDIQRIADNGNLFKSRRLRILTNQDIVEIQGQSAQLPNINQYLDEFDKYMNWEENDPKPVRGIISAYDEMCDAVQKIKDRFEQYISNYRKLFNDYKNVNYSHAKFRYEIEVPEVYVSRQKPDEFEFTSARQGFKRYRTKFLKDLAAELEEAEFEQNKKLTLFVQVVFKHFKEMQPIWDKFINILNELDAICSISTYGDNCQTQTCWPKFVTGKPHLFIKNGKHPQLEHQSLIPNNVDIGVDNENFILITGPNMGGKSTILRMTCVLTILAQMGSQVPCEQMELTPVDMIFTRIGAKDSLLEQKSTFYIELEETLQPLKIGTQNSLFIADELGRGTSTYDGIAIAYGVMRYITEKLKCRTMFATHYRLLVEEAKLLGQITNMHMACMAENDMVILLYKLRLGECPKSFGINVAKSVGIHNSIIQKAEIKSMEYEQNSSVKAQEEIIKNFNILLSDVLQ